MAVQIGTAANYTDLFDKLVTFLTTNAALVAAGQQWQVLRDSTPAAYGYGRLREVALKGTGLAGTDEFFIEMSSYQDAASDYYGMGARCMAGFLPSGSYIQHPGLSPEVYLNLWNDPIPFWFVANGRRVVVVAKISTVYVSWYLGAFVPFGTPTEYTYPMFIGGNPNSGRWSGVSASYRSFFDPYSGGAYGYWVDGQWLDFTNTNTDYSSSRYQTRNVSPYEGPGWTREMWSVQRDNVDGGFTLWPLTLNGSSPTRAIWGELDGVYAVSGFNNASENIIQSGGVDHLVFQNLYRTGRVDYAALKLA